ncbi:xanthoxin dehydrogenase-like [Tripterygium wilfordii]|uniref:Xanthoxin dehydrogenase-like n=1 Tax=Tripterygium wilfordii TaxID=458696 RepID=A0A7J7D7Z5_TRIWF|nr:xanthoxin dehydrogenase-like [Tripterygium wilfordii]KAF5742434.1 xanthoxin dehydrogenase-like [Tripterygium wilfordii]
MPITTTTTRTNGVDSSLPSQRLLGKVAIVTGGASGIGEGIVRLFHQHGAKICILDVQDKLGQQLCESLSNDNDSNNICYIRCDVSNEDEVSHAIESTVKKFGTLDIMVNNAGVMEPPSPDIRDFNLQKFEKTMSINAKGTFIGMKHAARIMIPNKKGTIISTSSMSSVIAGVAPHAYTASKHAIVGLTQNVAAELGKHGIRVNCVSPYGVPTPLALSHMAKEQVTDEVIAGLQKMTTMLGNLQGVDLTVDDVANAVLFLASDDAKYVSGTNLVVDGGFSSVNHSFGFFR